MATYTICPNLVEYCANNYNYLANILYVFVLDNPIAIAIDKKKESEIIKIYKSIHHFEILKWLDFLEKARGDDAFEKINIPKNIKGKKDIFFCVCSNTVGKRNFFVLDKDEYKSKPRKKFSVNLLSKLEAKAELSQYKNQISISATDHSNVTFGSQSPINSKENKNE